jgi:ubiquinone/menaquinone biosynthesis C-methylase UbiE
MEIASEILSNTLNKEAFTRSDVVDYYRDIDSLFESEKVLFRKLHATIKDARILDLGIGAGRTTKFLLQISRNYTGIDYVPKFVDQASERFPDADLLVGDARDLSRFSDNTFDFVLFSYNGLGCVSHEDRLKALSEIHRVLKKDGYFMFSAHNREYRYFKKLPWRRRIEFDTKFLKFYLYCLYHLPKHWAMRKHEIDTDDYAVVNDSDHRYSLMFYYIRPDKQVKQLQEQGFYDVEIYDDQGREVNRDVGSHWLNYLAKKA